MVFNLRCTVSNKQWIYCLNLLFSTAIFQCSLALRPSQLARARYKLSSLEFYISHDSLKSVCSSHLQIHFFSHYHTRAKSHMFSNPANQTGSLQSAHGRYLPDYCFETIVLLFFLCFTSNYTWKIFHLCNIQYDAVRHTK